MLLLVAAGLVLSGRADPQATVKGYLRPDDPLQIQRAVSHYRWAAVGESLTEHDFKFLFSSCFLEMAVGRVREIGSEADRPMIGFGRSITNPSSCAYAISVRGHSQRSFYYRLARTTNGWAVSPPALYR
jgi:hypothetical protein